MEDQSLQQALRNYIENKATPDEVRWLLAHFHTASEDELMQLIMKGFDLDKHDEAQNNPDQAVLNRVYGQLQQELGFSGEDRTPRRSLKFRNYAAAAAVLAGLTLGGYFLLYKKPPIAQTAQNQHNDIAPGSNKAILTLSNGQKIILDGKKGQIASQGGKAVMISANGNINYSGQANSGEVVYNTLTVPTGNRRDLTLPDGTQVSLDAGSSITYPIVFDKDRRISMTGQAYFKVQHDSAHPFYTTVKGITIQDIGTEFNISAYDDEPAVKTTLIEGSVKVNDLTLKPGEQAASKNDHTIIEAADLKSVTAWKDNDFFFRNQSLRTSMQQIARWYNVNVVYHNVDEKLQLFVDVSRSINLSVVLKAIENTGKVKCSLDGHTITLSQPN